MNQLDLRLRSLAFVAVLAVGAIVGCSEPNKVAPEEPDDGKVELTLSLIRKLRLDGWELKDTQVYISPAFTLKKSDVDVSTGENDSGGVEETTDTELIEFDDRTPAIVVKSKIYPESSGAVSYVYVKFGENEDDELKFASSYGTFSLDKRHAVATDDLPNHSIYLLVDLKQIENVTRRKARGMTIENSDEE